MPWSSKISALSKKRKPDNVRLPLNKNPAYHQSLLTTLVSTLQLMLLAVV